MPDQQDRLQPVVLIHSDKLAEAGLGEKTAAWISANRFEGKYGQMLAIPDDAGGIAKRVFGLGASGEPIGLATGLASANLPGGKYYLQAAPGTVLESPNMVALGFKLGAYRFGGFSKSSDPVELAGMEGADAALVDRLTDGAFIARDLINRPPNDLGPDSFEAEVRAFAKQRGAQVSVVKGDALLSENFPMIHAVGRASAEAPRLVDLCWGPEDAPKVTLAGKGVTFDTGGLDIKTPAGMVLMKKDMGGAANILGLAHAVISAKLRVRLRVLLPIVENSIAGAAFRPSDILPSRAGLNVEIGNTDAEGRLILADALALADEEAPQVLIDMATLTGSARVALGPELPALFSTSDSLADQMQSSGQAYDDSLWRMPLWPGYEKMLSSKFADLNHIAPNSFAGSVVAALFLRRFVKQATEWAHLDIYGWAPEPRAGRSFGGTDQGIRAAYFALAERYPAM